MQIDRVRHDGGADDADCEQQSAGVGELRGNGAERRLPPIDRRDEHLDQVAERDDGDEAADDQFKGAEAAVLHHQDGIGDDRGDHHAGQ